MFFFEQFIEFLVLKIPSYDDVEWISNPVDLGIRKKNDPNEQIIIFRHEKQILVRKETFLFSCILIRSILLANGFTY